MTAALSRINFRDLGGLPTLDGRRIRPRALYRSEGPARMADDHQAELRALGIRTVCDLRSESEISAAPHTWCGPECRVLTLEMRTDLRAQNQAVWAALRADPSAANLASVMIASYQAMPHALLTHISTISSALIDDETPLVIHCTAGKDRTGVAVALFLSVLHVSGADIFADYAESAPFMDSPHMTASVERILGEGIGIRPSQEMMRIMMGIDAAYLSAAFAEVEERWGGISGYFTAADVDAHEQQRLRAVLLQ
jgi:protein-tyrosine phosphatase